MSDTINAGDPGYKSKGFTKYVLEGLMIFVAVVLGFISENIRQDIVAKKMTKEFALSMVENLKSDTTNLRDYIAYFSLAASNMDSINGLLLTNDLKDIPTGKLYYYGLWGGADRAYVSNDASFQQMRNSGLLQNISNKSLLKNILNYDRLNQVLHSEEQRDNLIYVEVRKIRGQIFNYKYNIAANAIVQANRTKPDKQKIHDFLESEPPLLTYDPILFNQYMELVRSRNIKNKVHEANVLLDEASKLIAELKKHY
ncbi:hypothetical protein ACS386_13725 [Flavobacteriaceae bacterium LMO-SS05]